MPCPDHSPHGHLVHRRFCCCCTLDIPSAPQLYPEFFCRPDDPSYLKAQKIEVLIAIADQTNAYDIAEEMTQVRGAAAWLGRAARRREQERQQQALRRCC